MIYGDNPKDPLGLNRYTPDISAIRQSGNLYLYCSNNPIMYVDPTGQNDLRLHQIFAWLDRGAKWLKNGGAAVVSLCMGLLPVAGEGIDAKEAFTGEEFLTGEPLSTGERFMSGGAAVLPFVSGTMLRSAVKFGKEAFTSRNIRFTQDSISSSFSNGSSVKDMINGLNSGTIKPSDVPPIRIFEKDGVIHSLDNRRLYAFQEAKVDNIPYKWATPEEIIDESWKITTKNGGTSIKVRGDN